MALYEKSWKNITLTSLRHPKIEFHAIIFEGGTRNRKQFIMMALSYNNIIALWLS